jgi:hypothetical protein
MIGKIYRFIKALFQNKEMGNTTKLADSIDGEEDLSIQGTSHIKGDRNMTKLPDSIVSFGGSEEGLSIQGASHIKSGKVCQDCGGHFRCDDYAVAVVCDGHGGDAYFRSDRGSKYAVETCINSIKEFMQGKTELLDRMSKATNEIGKEKESNHAIEQLIQNIIFRWSEQVSRDIAENPFADDETFNALSEKYRERYGADDDSKFPAYGTTLIAVVRTPEFWFGIRIGDGRCISIAADGSIEDPIPWNEKCFLNATVSLCDEKAFANFRYCFHTDNFPVAIYVGTDGIDDSFGIYGNDEKLFNFYRNLTKAFSQSGFEGGKQELKEYLPVLTAKGSGDDVSISGIVDMEAIKGLSGEQPEEKMEVVESKEIPVNAEKQGEIVIAENAINNDNNTIIENDGQ